MEREESRKKMREDLQAKRQQAKIKTSGSKDFEIVGMSQPELDSLAKESEPKEKKQVMDSFESQQHQQLQDEAKKFERKGWG